MAYKKYIVKNGKVYGPYVYHSRRVNGKVVSEYRGSNKKLNYKKFGGISLGVLGLLVLVFLAINFISFDKTITGFASLDLEANYQEGQSLSGNLKFSLDEEELVPVSSKVIFKNAGNNYEYSLSDFITSTGSESDYPEVSFTLDVLSYSEEETSEEVIEEPVEEVIEESIEEEIVEEEPIVEEVVEEPEETEPVLSMTGNIILELQKQVEGKVKFGEDFVYNLEEGETVEILSGSIKTDSKELADSEIKLSIEENQAIVTTDYLEVNEQEYLGQEGLIIDLSELDLILEQGDLEIVVVYGNEEIVSLTTVLKEEEVVKQEVTAEIKEEIIQEEIIKEIIEENVTEEIKSFDSLTDAEREIIFNEFGDDSLKVTKSEIVNNRLIIRNELGSFWVEYSYGTDLSPEELDEQMRADKVKWLKDIVKILSVEEDSPEEVSEFLGNVSI